MNLLQLDKRIAAARPTTLLVRSSDTAVCQHARLRAREALPEKSAAWRAHLGAGAFFHRAHDTGEIGVGAEFVAGYLQEAGDRTIEQLEHERDEVLLGLLKLRSKQGKAFPVVKKVAKAK